MNIKSWVVGVLVVGSALTSVAQAGSYTCKVYCKGPDGSTSVKVNASSRSDAANTVDGQGHQVCRAAGYDRATPGTMSSDQCY